MALVLLVYIPYYGFLLPVTIPISFPFLLIYLGVLGGPSISDKSCNPLTYLFTPLKCWEILLEETGGEEIVDLFRLH